MALSDCFVMNRPLSRQTSWTVTVSNLARDNGGLEYADGNRDGEKRDSEFCRVEMVSWGLDNRL